MNEARRQRLLAIAQRVGTPAFVYFVDEMRERASNLARAFGGRCEVSYAIKANPAAGVLAALRGAVASLDVSSAGEIDRALAAGWAGASLGFTGPAKRPFELARALDVGIGVIVLESLDEAIQLDALARERGVVQRVLLRITPDQVPPGFGDTMSGKPVAFGVDEEDLPRVVPQLRALRGLALVGFHVFSGTQCLRADAVAANWAIHARLFRTTAALAGIVPERLVLGAGLGIPYHDDQQPLDLAAVEHAATPVLAELRAAFPGARLVLETGRWIAGEAGVYLTRVLRTKDSRGTRIGVCDGGLHHHLAACGLFGMVLRRNYRMANLSAPPGPAAGTFQLSGPLCTSIDVLGRNVALPRVDAGDVIAIECSGAYGATASPAGFLSHPAAREWVVRGDDVGDAHAPPG